MITGVGLGDVMIIFCIVVVGDFVSVCECCCWLLRLVSEWFWLLFCDLSVYGLWFSFVGWLFAVCGEVLCCGRSWMFDFVVLLLMVYGWLGIFVCFVWFCECFVYWGWVGCVLWFGCFCRFGLFDCLRLWFVFRLEFVCLGIVCRICLVFCYFVVGVVGCGSVWGGFGY